MIIDERKARRIAKEMGITITGTLGFLIESKARGKIEAIKPLLDIMINSGIRIGDTIYKEALYLSEELDTRP